MGIDYIFKKKHYYFLFSLNFFFSKKKMGGGETKLHPPLTVAGIGVVGQPHLVPGVVQPPSG
jgi:hypothetical protein